MRDREFAARLREHREGKIDLNQLLRSIDGVLRDVSASMLRHWRCPPAVSVDDVVQEMRIGVVVALRRYDPGRPKVAELHSFVMYFAYDKAKKWLHKQRGACLHGNPDSAVGRMHVLECQLRPLMGTEEPATLDQVRGARAMPAQEATVDREQAVRSALASATSARVRWALLALAAARRESIESVHGWRRAAVQVLYGDCDVRLRLRMGNERSAERAVDAALRHMAKAAA